MKLLVMLLDKPEFIIFFLYIAFIILVGLSQFYCQVTLFDQLENQEFKSKKAVFFYSLVELLLSGLSSNKVLDP